LVSETESYKEDSLDFFIDNTIITPCSPDSLRAGLAIAVQLKEVLLKLEDIIHGEDPRKTIASGVLLAGEHRVATKSLLQLVCRKLLCDNHYEELEEILNILSHKIKDPWIDLITVSLLMGSERYEEALRYIEEKKQWHEPSSDLFLLEARINSKIGKNMEAVSILSDMLPNRKADICIYHEIIDMLLCTKEQNNIYEYLIESCNIGFKTELRRKSYYIKLCELIIEDLSIAENLCPTKIVDLDRTLNMIDILFEEKIETKVIVSIFQAKLNIFRKKFDDAEKYANEALEVYNSNNVMLSPKYMKMLREAFTDCGREDQVKIIDNICSGIDVKEDNEILLNINEYYISEHAVKLLSYARESIIIVLSSKKKKITGILCSLRPGNIALFQGVSFFQEIITKMVDELLTYKVDKSDIEVYVYGTKLSAGEDEGDTKVSTLDQVIKVFSQMSITLNRTNISDSDYIAVEADVISKNVVVSDISDNKLISFINEREGVIKNIAIEVDQIEKKDDDQSSSMGSA
jgi:tetratricopeptide (TPR) repeat protein